MKKWTIPGPNNCLLEDQLRVTAPKATEIKSQLAIHEVAVRLLEPTDLKTVAAKAAAWKEFIGELAGPS